MFASTLVLLSVLAATTAGQNAQVTAGWKAQAYVLDEVRPMAAAGTAFQADSLLSDAKNGCHRALDGTCLRRARRRNLAALKTRNGPLSRRSFLAPRATFVFHPEVAIIAGTARSS